MKFLRRTAKTLFFLLLILDVAAFSLVIFMRETFGSDYKINRGETLRFDTVIPVTAAYNGTQLSQSGMTGQVGQTFPVDLKLFGAIPFSTVEVEVVDEKYVAVLGNPFGMKLYTDGVLVISLTEVDGKNGSVNPAAQAGIRTGDYILNADGVPITCNEDLTDLMDGSDGTPVNLTVLRGGEKKNIAVKPEKSVESGGYRLGIWVRDSSAGIGTLTFYSPSTGIVCGLGHGVCDEDTGGLLTLESGELVGAQIVSVEKGSDGSPGELRGRFTGETVAAISANESTGVYGVLKGSVDISNLTEIALKQEVHDGAAQILCTVDGEKPKLYTCAIKKRTATYLSKTQNLIVTVTDPDLIDVTGGIVQGMSGSPILQDGKLIGAVTHVLIDDSKSGYGIFAENMLISAEDAAETAWKEAS